MFSCSVWPWVGGFDSSSNLMSWIWDASWPDHAEPKYHLYLHLQRPWSNSHTETHTLHLCSWWSFCTEILEPRNLFPISPEFSESCDPKRHGYFVPLSLTRASCTGSSRFHQSNFHRSPYTLWESGSNCNLPTGRESKAQRSACGSLCSLLGSKRTKAKDTKSNW